MQGDEPLTTISPILTNDYLSQKLSAWFKLPIDYSGYLFVDLTGKGDSYLSDVVRVIILGEVKSPQEDGNNKFGIQVVLKSLPKNIARRKSFRCDEVFRNEITFYGKVLPEMLHFQKEKLNYEEFDHIPKVFAMHTDGMNDFIALEDLTVRGYGGPTRQVGIDLEHCTIILETLAKFHGLSMAFKDQHREKFEVLANSLSETYYHTRLWGWYERFWKRLCVCAVDAVDKEYPNSIYSEKIKDFATEKTFLQMVEATCNSKTYGCIGHGDMWTNNFLVKYTQDKTPVHGILIDFQLARHCSPVLDLSFFIYACTEKALRDEHYDSMLKFYHVELSKQINLLGSDADSLYPWNIFMDEIRKYSFFGLAFSFESTPFIVLSPEDAIEVNSIQGTDPVNIADVWTIGVFKDVAGRLREANNVVHAVDKGYI